MIVLKSFWKSFQYPFYFQIGYCQAPREWYIFVQCKVRQELWCSSNVNTYSRTPWSVFLSINSQTRIRSCKILFSSLTGLSRLLKSSSNSLWIFAIYLLYTDLRIIVCIAINYNHMTEVVVDTLNGLGR